jgi:hypothetical protein
METTFARSVDFTPRQHAIPEGIPRPRQMAPSSQPEPSRPRQPLPSERSQPKEAPAEDQASPSRVRQSNGKFAAKTETPGQTRQTTEKQIEKIRRKYQQKPEQIDLDEIPTDTGEEVIEATDQSADPVDDPIDDGAETEERTAKTRKSDKAAKKDPIDALADDFLAMMGDDDGAEVTGQAAQLPQQKAPPKQTEPEPEPTMPAPVMFDDGALKAIEETYDKDLANALRGANKQHQAIYRQLEQAAQVIQGVQAHFSATVNHEFTSAVGELVEQGATELEPGEDRRSQLVAQRALNDLQTDAAALIQRKRAQGKYVSVADAVKAVYRAQNADKLIAKAKQTATQELRQKIQKRESVIDIDGAAPPGGSRKMGTLDRIAAIKRKYLF